MGCSDLYSVRHSSFAEAIENCFHVTTASLGTDSQLKRIDRMELRLSCVWLWSKPGSATERRHSFKDRNYFGLQGEELQLVAYVSTLPGERQFLSSVQEMLL